MLTLAIGLGLLGASFGRLGLINKKRTVSAGTPTGDGKMRFNLNPGIDTGLLALLEDI